MTSPLGHHAGDGNRTRSSTALPAIAPFAAVAAVAAVVLLLTSCASSVDVVGGDPAPPEVHFVVLAAVLPPVSPPTTITAPPTSIEPEIFIVTEEIYARTFEEVEELITELNTIIRNRNFDAWTSYLTTPYVAQVSDPEYLARLSESPILTRNNVVLTSIDDFFAHIVVPSRSNAKLDTIEFIDDKNVKAISMTSRGPGVLYYLVRIEGTWKIGVF